MSYYDCKWHFNKEYHLQQRLHSEPDWGIISISGVDKYPSPGFITLIFLSEPFLFTRQYAVAFSLGLS